MKKSTILKIIIAILIAITLFLIFTQNSFALNYDIGSKFVNEHDKSNATNTAAGIIGKTINIIQVIGMGVAIIMLVVTGIRWINASPSGKANIKKESIYYVMGAVFIFATMGLIQIIRRFAIKGIIEQV